MYNDYELVYLAQEYNEDAIEILYRKYKNLIYSKAYKYYFMLKHCGLEFDDVIQEAMIAFDDAIKCFNQENDCNFLTFAYACIIRKLNSLFKKYNNKKNILLNSAISLESNLYDIIYDKNDIPDNEIFSLDDSHDLYNKIKCKLSNFEDFVFELKINNFSNTEIMNILDVNYKNVCNAVIRIRNKINNIIGENS